MSQKVSRKTAVGDDKEKRPTESPVKDIKKKMAATADKEKLAEKPAEKATDKNASVTEKKESRPSEKAADKKDQKNEKVVDKKEQKNEKAVDKKEQKSEKAAEKKTEEKPKEDSSSRGEKSNKQPEKPEEPKPKRAEHQKPKQNGSSSSNTNGTPTTNGVSDVILANGAGENKSGHRKLGLDPAVTGTTASDDSDSDVMLVISDQEQDDLYPELTYDDNSEDFEPSGAESRSFTRRSQVKATRTPETPRPNSDKRPDSEDTKVLKLKDDVSTERKLRSSDSPKPEGKKSQEPGKITEKPQEPAKKPQENEPKVTENKVEDDKENAVKTKPVEVIVQVELEDVAVLERRKADTNFSKSRVKVSPYRRSHRLADQTTTSTTANYTGNNSTMEMDITEPSMSEEVTLDDSSYLSGLRSIRSRRSYKLLNELNIKTLNRTAKSNVNVSESYRPTGTVVGRKRKQDASGSGVELAREAGEAPASAPAPALAPADQPYANKRLRLLDRISMPFRNVQAAVPIAVRNQEIVGINTDLPLTAPVVVLDPENLKPTEHTVPQTDSKRCVIM